MKKVLNIISVVVITVVVYSFMSEDSVPATAKPLNERVAASVEKAIGSKTNMGEKRIIGLGIDQGNIAIMRLHGDDNFTDNLTIKSIWIQTKEVLPAIFENSDVQKAVIEWNLGFVDDYGKVSVKPVMQLAFTRQTVEKIEFDTVPFDSIPKIADEYKQTWRP
ncbi:hypothetical protein [Paenibacillus sp. EPM92]|uniref:hypothetical protein n=1 Tax=Paenibacillus sp. EPM92 TaxID=1561195 RepID=UPI001916AEA5|nr:hypothetical protein [Paenibacillus sp. EPM92]